MTDKECLNKLYGAIQRNYKDAPLSAHSFAWIFQEAGYSEMANELRRWIGDRERCLQYGNQPPQPPTQEPYPNEELLNKIVSCFKNRATAKQFIEEIEDKDNTGITKIIKRYMKDDRIPNDFKRKTLWTALHDDGRYDASCDNFCTMIRD